MPCAEASRRLPPAYVPARAVAVETRGAGSATRQINNLFVAGGPPAHRLVVVEVLTPGGNWSSYPPHKHDDATTIGEAELEEIYYFRISGPNGFGLHRTYTADRTIDETVVIHDGDVFLVPRGYHGPCVAPPDYPMYYLNVLAGPSDARSLGFSDDPAYAWIRRSWAGLADRSPGAAGERRGGGAMTRRAPATERLTVAQALVRFLAAQRVERDGVERPFFAGVFGIFGHGNVAGIGQALQQYASRLRYYQSRNEQAQVHAAAAYARMTNRLQTLACTSSVGPGATNMITGAAGATINRLPVLLLPGDVFATRRVGTVLQQLEAGWSQEVSVNDAFRPVSRYWDRISRPEQLIHAALEAMRVLTSQSETGAVTLALPQDVQAEAFD